MPDLARIQEATAKPLMQPTAHTIGLSLFHKADRRLLAGFLEELGYRVVTDTLTDATQEQWQNTSLIIADEKAARFYGSRLLDLKWRLGTSFLPLLIALPQQADSLPWLRAGFDDVLRLPIKKAELHARLSVFIRLREQSEQRYRVIVENALIGLFLLSSEGHLVTANPALLGMLGYDAFDALADDVEANQRGGAYLRRILRHCDANAGKTVGLETSWTRADGQTVFLRENAAAVRDDEGRTVSYEGTVEDISERKRYERALREAKNAAEAASRAKSTFLANMSHEIRTPLTGILGFTSHLTTHVQPELRRFVERIERSGQRLMETLESILTLAKLEANRLEMNREPLDVAAEAAEMVALFRPQADKKALDLHFDVDPEAGPIRAHLDRGSLTSILQNLIGNAIKFTAEGHVGVQVDADEEHVRIHVEDTGVGMDPAFLLRLFEAFNQESSGMNRSHEGNGLGLYITHELVERMDGTIEVDSEKGRGTRFTVVFPRLHGHASPSSEEAGPERPTLSPRTDGRPRLLVVEDNQDTQFLMQTLLEEIAEVNVATNAADALSLAYDTVFDLVIMDIHLGQGPDGTEVLKNLRRMPAYRNVPIIALTAYALPGDREDFLSNGFDTYLSKPFTADELLALTSRFLANHP